jgi:hypothetical protein
VIFDVLGSIGSLGTLAVAIAAAIFAFVQIRDARRLREEQAAPYVIARFRGSEASPKIIDFVIINIGTTPAFDVRIAIEPDMERAQPIADYPFMSAKPVKSGIAMLAPQQEIVMFFDMVTERVGKGLPSEFRVTISSKNSKRKQLPDASFDLDIDWGWNTVHAEVHNQHWIGSRIKGIEEAVGQISKALYKMVPPPLPRPDRDEKLLAQQLRRPTIRIAGEDEDSSKGR